MEKKISNLGPIPAETDSVRKQMEELKVSLIW